MENTRPLDAQAGTQPAADADSVVDRSKRSFLRAAGLLVAGQLLPQARAGKSFVSLKLFPMSVERSTFMPKNGLQLDA